MDMTVLTSYFNLEHLDNLKVSMGGGTGAHLLNVALGLVMFGIALGIKPSNFVDIINLRDTTGNVTVTAVFVPATYTITTKIIQYKLLLFVVFRPFSFSSKLVGGY